jgi:hypothetical protein
VSTCRDTVFRLAHAKAPLFQLRAERPAAGSDPVDNFCPRDKCGHLAGTYPRSINATRLFSSFQCRDRYAERMLVIAVRCEDSDCPGTRILSPSDLFFTRATLFRYLLNMSLVPPLIDGTTEPYRIQVLFSGCSYPFSALWFPLLVHMSGTLWSCMHVA